MFSIKDIKEDPELRSLFRYYSARLYLTLNGSAQTYLAITQDIFDEGKRRKAWDEYNELFKERILASLIDVFDRNNCGVAEVCTAVLKLLEIAGGCVADVEQEHDKEARAVEYWEEKFSSHR